jgi:hypothetical protein
MHSLEFIQIKCEQLAENKIFIGLVMIMVNIGARFIIEELSDEHREIAKGETFRKIVIFCSVFMATRDIMISLIVTIIFIVVMNEVLKTEDTKIADKEGDNKGSSFAKQELDKQIDQLKLIKDSL